MDLLTIFFIIILPNFISPILGIVGYYTNIGWLLHYAALYIIINTFFSNLSVFNIVMHIAACIIGTIIAIFLELPILGTLAVAICFEWLAVNSVLGILTLLNSRKM